MEHPHDIEKRLTELEIKASFTEDLVDRLDQVIVRQQQQIDLLMRELAHLRQPTTVGNLDVARSASDDLPPHY